MSSKIIEWVGLFASGFLMFAISLWLIVFAMFKACEIHLARKDERFKEYILGQLHAYDRWMCHDFPQVSEMLNQLEVEIKNGWRTGGQDTFREHMRSKYLVSK